MVKLKIKKVQYDNNKEPAKTSALSLGKIDKYEFLIQSGQKKSHQF